MTRNGVLPWHRLADVFRSLGISGRLIALVLVVVLPFGCYVVFEAFAAADDAKREIGLRNEALASVIAARLDDHVGDINQLLATLGHVVSGEREKAAANDALLREVKADAPAFIRSLVAFDVNGHCVGTTDPATRDIDVSDRRFFQDSLRTRRLAVDGPIVARGSGETLVVFARPVERHGRVAGIVAVSIAVSHLDQLLDVKGVLPSDAAVVVATRTGAVLKQSGVSGGAPRAFAPEDIARFAQERSGTFDSAALDGVARSFGFARTSRAPWVIEVGLREEIATAPVWERLQRTLAIGGCALFAALLLASLIARDISRPIARLTDDARRLALGDLSHRPTMRRTDEIGVLGRTLNAMAAQIEHQTSRLARNERELRLLTDNLPALIVRLDRFAQYTFVNAYAAQLFESDLASILGRSIRDVRGEVAWAELEPHFLQALGGEAARFNHRYATSSGERELAIAYLPDRDEANEARGVFVLGIDLTERRALEAKLERMAQFDQLTELPNRYLLQDRLAQLCHRSWRDGTRLAVFYLDLDGFKPVNDRHGHAAGDHLLRAIAARLVGAVRKSDTVARLGGDEFVIVVDGFLSFAHLHALAHKLVDVIAEPIEWQGSSLSCSVSIGVAAHPPGASWETLIDAADRAMYQAKSRGPGAVAIAPMRHDAAAAA